MANNKSIVDKILDSMDSDFKPSKSPYNKNSYLLKEEENEKKQNQQNESKKEFVVAERNSAPLTIKKDENFDVNSKGDKVVPNVTVVPATKNEITSSSSSKDIVVKQKDNGIKIKKEISSLQDINRNTMVQILSNREKTFSKTFNIKIIGIGGAGNNIVKYMVSEQEWPDFVDVIALNTDYVALSNIGNNLKNIFILGAEELNGNGSGGDPTVGEKAAEADIETLKQLIEGTDVLILVAGLGKGTGTGATPIIAKAAQEMGILTIGVFNLPSIGAEGNKTYSNALFGLQKLSYVCNGLTTVNNDKIINLDKEKTSIKKAYQGANKYIKTIVEEIIEIIVKPSDINVDFADVKNFFQDKNGFMFSRVSLSDYTKDAIKDQLENAIKQGFSEINYKGSEKALINFKLNENVPSVILENTRSALKELVDSGNINIVHGVAYNDIFENAEINILLTGSFELGAIEDVDNKTIDIEEETKTSKPATPEVSVYDTLKEMETNGNISSNSISSSINSWENSSINLSKNSKTNFYSTAKLLNNMDDEDDEDDILSKRGRTSDIYSSKNGYKNDYTRKTERSYYDDDEDDYYSNRKNNSYSNNRERNKEKPQKKQGFFAKLFKRSKSKKYDEDY